MFYPFTSTYDHMNHEKFHGKRSARFWAIRKTDRQTDAATLYMCTTFAAYRTILVIFTVNLNHRISDAAYWRGGFNNNNICNQFRFHKDEEINSQQNNTMTGRKRAKMQEYKLRQSLRTFSSSAVLRADSTSLQPTRASWYATCLPIPLDAPVIHATWPFRTSATVKRRTCTVQCKHHISNTRQCLRPLLPNHRNSTVRKSLRNRGPRFSTLLLVHACNSLYSL